MNKVITKFAKLSGLSMLTLAFAFGCKADIINPDDGHTDGNEGTIPLPSITAHITPMTPGDGETKITTTPDGKVSWDANDQLTAYVVDAGYKEDNRVTWSQHKFLYTTSENECQKNVFKPSIDPQDPEMPMLSEGKSYDWYIMSPYGKNLGNPIAAGNNPGFVEFPDKLTIDVDHLTAHLTKYDYMAATSLNVPVDQAPAFELEHKATLMKFTFVNEDASNMTIDDITFSVPEDTYIAGKFRMDFNKGVGLVPNNGRWDKKSIATVSFTQNGEKAALSLQSGASVDIFVTMPPFTLKTGSAFTIQTTTSVGNLTRTTTAASDIEFKAGTINTADVKLKATHVESIVFDPAAIQMQKGEQKSILPTFTPANADNKSLLWETSDASVVTVDEAGMLTAVGSGVAVIKATTVDGGKTAECTVTVVKLNKTHLVMKQGTTETLEILNLDPAAGTVTWTTSNEAVATVAAGTVNAVATGFAEIKATVGTLTFTAGVTVCAKDVNPIVVMYKETPIHLIQVNSGTFDMGSTTAGENASPVHKVTLDSYLIGQFEVTQELWTEVMGTNPSSNKENALFPAENMKWDEIQTFLQKLSSATGLTFSLPTEAQWEFAARGGNNSKNYIYSGSNNIADVAWNQTTSPKVGYYQYSQIVGQKMANELGIYDMSGNVREFCSDWYAAYAGGALINPTGPTSGSKVVVRGGCFDKADAECTVSFRYSENTSYGYSKRNGFRVVVTNYIPVTTPDWNPGNNGWFK